MAESQSFEKKVNKKADSEQEISPKPVYERDFDRQDLRLKDKVAIITGGDSGIGRAIAVHFAREGANVAIIYKDHDEDAEETKKLIEEKGRKALLIKKDVSIEANCIEAIETTVKTFGKLDIVVNNAAVQYPQENIEDITEEQLDKTFRVNFYSYFFICKAALKHLKSGSSIINNASVNAYRGNKELIDYSSTKGAIMSFTRSLSASLAEKNIRVNAVAPGPIWTPLVSSTFTGPDIGDFGKETPMKRPGQPAEVATCFLFLASDESSYITGQALHPNGGTVLNT